MIKLFRIIVNMLLDGLSACDDLNMLESQALRLLFEEINHDCLTEEEKTMFDMIEKQYMHCQIV